MVSPRGGHHRHRFLKQLDSAMDWTDEEAKAALEEDWVQARLPNMNMTCMH